MTLAVEFILVTAAVTRPPRNDARGSLVSCHDIGLTSHAGLILRRFPRTTPFIAQLIRVPSPNGQLCRSLDSALGYRSSTRGLELESLVCHLAAAHGRWKVKRKAAKRRLLDGLFHLRNGFVQVQREIARTR